MSDPVNEPMNDPIDEDVSAWIDGECCGEPGCSCGLAFCESLRGDADARNDWFIVHTIGDALRGRPVLDDGFSLRIIERVDTSEIDPGYDPLAES